MAPILHVLHRWERVQMNGNGMDRGTNGLLSNSNKVPTRPTGRQHIQWNDSKIKASPPMLQTAQSIAITNKVLSIHVRDDIRRSHGLTGHFRDLIKGYAKIEGPLHDLIKEVEIPKPTSKTTYHQAMKNHKLSGR
ncbi:hypothetical protein PISMIDRAFT_18261 [Pisolithus microcarpus 441]|uniref:Uncharacterized protein n=1 Tax=Pisolithus microcarpus 441 TaxID=765257 RepID=A0A0C9YYW8_9AGAM|nr:hypothetical protein PISMIDRAFT_18261 [Pisolithus microcarpus 441]